VSIVVREILSVCCKESHKQLSTCQLQELHTIYALQFRALERTWLELGKNLGRTLLEVARIPRQVYHRQPASVVLKHETSTLRQRHTFISIDLKFGLSDNVREVSEPA